MSTEKQQSRGITIRPGENKTEKQSLPYQLARAYIPWQRYTNKWEPFEGLARGTIFPELYMPYKPRKHPY